MNHYIIARRNTTTKALEYLRVLDCGKHQWLSDRRTSTIYNRPKMEKKVKTLSKYGKQECMYFPIYVFQQDELFPKQ